jgi:hypothetical protein
VERRWYPRVGIQDGIAESLKSSRTRFAEKDMLVLAGACFDGSLTSWSMAKEDARVRCCGRRNASSAGAVMRRGDPALLAPPAHPS